MNWQRRIGVASFAVVIVYIAVGGWKVSAATNQLELGFDSPPADCRPQVLWDWMGGMVSRDGITKDLEALKAQGIGGVLIMQMPDQPPYPRQWSFRDYPGKLKCLSDEYFATMNFGIAEADRLGLEFGVYACPGWSHLGGPWVKPDDGLKKLACSRIYVTGPTNLSVQLERAPITIGYRGGNEMPEWSRDVKLLNVRYGNFHQDEGVIALPWREPGNPISPGQITNLTSRMDAAGNFTWAVPPGSWTIWRLAVVSDNSVNHPAPVESIGLECDRMDAAALTPVLDNYVGRIAREAKAKGLHSFKRFESDSYEGGHQDYGRDFSAQFQKRRGYNCLPWLPAWLEPGVIIGDTNLTVRFRADMTATITELWAERFHAPLQKTADALGLEWMLEPYGMFELNWRDTAAQCAHPGWEFWVGQGWHAERVADTAALYGRRVVWAESFTAEPYRSAWRLDPWTLKRDGDRAWCGGVNSFFMHGFVHQPFGDEFQPGLTMGYWGTQLGRHVTWWNFSRPWHEYLARGQFLLRQGDPQNDVLLYPQPASDEAIRPLGGYRGVTLSDDILIHKLRVENGLLTLPHGAKFAALALNPGLPLRPEALAKIHRLVQDGAILIGDAPPPRSPSLENFPQCDAAVKNWISKLWGGQTNSPGRKLGQGIIFPAAEFFSTLENTIGPPDFAATDLADSTKSPPVLSFCRRAGETIFWVVSNQSDDEQAVLAQFRVTGLQELSFGHDPGFTCDGWDDLAVLNLNAAFKNAAHHAFLLPDLALGQFAIRVQAGQLGAGAGAARRTVVGLAGAEHKTAAVSFRAGAEQFHMVDLLTTRTGDTPGGQLRARAPGKIGQDIQIFERDIQPVVMHQEKPIPAPGHIAVDGAPVNLDRNVRQMPGGRDVADGDPVWISAVHVPCGFARVQGGFDDTDRRLNAAGAGLQAALV